MTVIVAQKPMNLARLILVAFSAIVALSGNVIFAEVAQTQPGNSRRTFGDCCRQKADLSPEGKHTVEVLLKEAGTTECDVANRKLSTFTELNLGRTEISDIKPLQSLTKLTELNLIENNIGDIKPLASLTQLTFLDLQSNNISDIKPLASLTKLTVLLLNNHKISDIKPLASLTNLT